MKPIGIAMLVLAATPLLCSAADELLYLAKPTRRGSALDDEVLRPWQAEWEAKREKLWVPLVRQAGRPRDGVLLRAWLQPPSAAVGCPARLILSLANLRDKPAAVAHLLEVPLEPEVFARDPAGAIVKLTKKGAFLSAGPHYGDGLMPPELPPGHAMGSTLELPDIVRLEKPGTYSVLAVQQLQGDMSGLAVSRVLSLELHPATGGELKAKTDLADRPPATLLPEAGHTLGGCVLEAVLSSLPGPPRLVVSLTCLSEAIGGGDEVWHHNCVVEAAGGKPTDYKVVVRDAAGNAVPMNERGRKAYAAPGSFESRVLRMGDATGAIIPLAEWFDLSKPGEYTVLVSIAAPGGIRLWTKKGPEWRPGPTWAAKPVKITVPAARK
jgi:hypothetical protein